MKKGHKKLPKKWQSGDGSKEDAAIEIIKKMHWAGGEAMLENWQRPSSLNGGGRGADLIERNGKLVWRIPGQAGADLDRHPLIVQAIRADQMHQTEIEKIEREVRYYQNSLKAAKISGEKRTKKGQCNKDAVLRLAQMYDNKSRDKIALISKKTGLSVRRIQQILQEKAKSTKIA